MLCWVDTAVCRAPTSPGPRGGACSPCSTTGLLIERRCTIGRSTAAALASAPAWRSKEGTPLTINAQRRHLLAGFIRSEGILETAVLFLGRRFAVHQCPLGADRLAQALTAIQAFWETLVRVKQVGFRTKTIIVVATLLDTEQITGDDLTQLYRVRWNTGPDLRSLKRTTQMEILRCKTPELVRKEIWTHLLAYDLIRTIIAQAAIKYGIAPRSIRSKARSR
jgi:hypothetical protein